MPHQLTEKLYRVHAALGQDRETLELGADLGYWAAAVQVVHVPPSVDLWANIGGGNVRLEEGIRLQGWRNRLSVQWITDAEVDGNDFYIMASTDPIFEYQRRSRPICRVESTGSLDLNTVRTALSVKETRGSTGLMIVGVYVQELSPDATLALHVPKVASAGYTWQTEQVELRQGAYHSVNLDQLILTNASQSGKTAVLIMYCGWRL